MNKLKASISRTKIFNNIPAVEQKCSMRSRWKETPRPAVVRFFGFVFVGDTSWHISVYAAKDICPEVSHTTSASALIA